ncbi:MAG: hypothetical protein AAGF85_21505 [Bacteroidota bacterium]
MKIFNRDIEQLSTQKILASVWGKIGKPSKEAILTFWDWSIAFLGRSVKGTFFRLKKLFSYYISSRKFTSLTFISSLALTIYLGLSIQGFYLLQEPETYLGLHFGDKEDGFKAYNRNIDKKEKLLIETIKIELEPLRESKDRFSVDIKAEKLENSSELKSYLDITTGNSIDYLKDLYFFPYELLAKRDIRFISSDHIYLNSLVYDLSNSQKFRGYSNSYGSIFGKSRYAINLDFNIEFSDEYLVFDDSKNASLVILVQGISGLRIKNETIRVDNKTVTLKSRNFLESKIEATSSFGITSRKETDGLGYIYYTFRPNSSEFSSPLFQGYHKIRVKLQGQFDDEENKALLEVFYRSIILGVALSTSSKILLEMIKFYEEQTNCEEQTD